jgi:enoyl-CoA hydratase/carnithine racemase
MNLKYVNYLPGFYKYISIIQLNYIAKKNALSQAVISELNEIVRENEKDKENKICIIESLCSNIFSSGHDLQELNKFQSNNQSGIFQIIDKCSLLMKSIEKSEKIFIAEVDGLATAAGLQLAFSCHQIVATENSKFSIPGMNIGLYAATPAISVLKNLPTKLAFEMLFSSKVYKCSDMYSLGVINTLTNSGNDNLRKATLNLAEKILINLNDIPLGPNLQS